MWLKACAGWLSWQTAPVVALATTGWIDICFCLVVSCTIILYKANSVLSHVECLCGYYGGFVFSWIFSGSFHVIAEIKRHGWKHTLSASPVATLIFRCCCCFVCFLFNDNDNDLILFLTYFNDTVAVLPKIYKTSKLDSWLSFRQW